MTSNIVPTPEEMKTLPSRGLQSSPPIWLKEKAERDKELWKTPDGDYWIVENKYYDLTKFIDRHPGGQSWIRLTKGQDITEHFVIHHLQEEKAREILKKYYIGDCPNKVTRYSFKEDGFYRTLKRRVLSKYSIDQIQNQSISKIYGLIILLAWVLCITSALYYQSIILSMLCAPLMMGLVGIGHNFVHHKESPFRYFLLLVGFTHKEWQIMHCISHHLYPNTELDFQNAAFEPIGYYLRSMPQNKSPNLLVLQIAFFFLQPLNMLLKILVLPIVRRISPDLLYSFPLLVLFGGALMHGSFWVGFKMYMIIYCFFSYVMMKALFCGHRIADTWTEGVEKNEDFGQHTIYATSDTDVWISGILSFILTVGFNIHVSHHLFPTADHHFLPKINQQVVQLCLQRGIKKNQKSRLECLTSIYKNFFNRQPFEKK